jgi:hypothetical protein
MSEGQEPEAPAVNADAEAAADATPGTPSATETNPESEWRPPLPPATFDFLVYSLRMQAEMSLGLLPFGEEAKADLSLARHHIDLLAMLQEKTKGNLSLEEQRALDNSVTELRFRYIQVWEKKPAKE